MEKVWEENVDRVVVEKIRECVVGVAERAVQECRWSEAEIDLAETKRINYSISFVLGCFDHLGRGFGMITYAGEVNFDRRASSTAVNVPCSRSMASRENNASVGMANRDCVTTKILWSSRLPLRGSER